MSQEHLQGQLRCLAAGVGRYLKQTHTINPFP